MSNSSARDGGARDRSLRGESKRDTTQTRERVRGIPIRGDRLQALRIERGWTQVEAAKAVGVAGRTYQTWEEGGRVSASNLTRVIEAFETTWEHLAGEGQVQALPVPTVEERLADLSAKIERLEGRLDERSDDLRQALQSVARALARQVTVQTEQAELQPLDNQTGSEEWPQRERRRSEDRRRRSDRRSSG